MWIVAPPSSAFPPALARALADEQIPSALRDALRGATVDGEEERLSALDDLQANLMLAQEPDDDEDDDDGDTSSSPHLARTSAELRLFPALIAVAAQREGPEQLALLALAGGLEMVRLAGDLDVPEDLGEDWDAAHALALRLSGAALAVPVPPEILRPLLACLAALQGDVAVASALAAANGDDDDDGEEEQEEEEEQS